MNVGFQMFLDYSCFCQTAIHHGTILLTDEVRRHAQPIINVIDDACIHRANVLTR